MPFVPITFTAGTAIAPADVNTNFSGLASYINGGLTKDNLSASAGILASQLAASYEHMNLVIEVAVISDVQPGPVTVLSTNRGLTPWTGWPATTYVGYVPLYGTTGDTGGDWTVTEVDWHCNDTGAGTGTWALYHCGYTGNPAAFTVIGAAVSSGTLSNGTGASTFNSVAVTGLSRALTKQAYPTMLALYANAADATALSAVGGFLTMSIGLRRTIAAV